MSLILILLCLFSFICYTPYLPALCFSGGPAPATPLTSVNLFTAGQGISNILKPKNSNGNTGSELTPNNFCSPQLVATNNVVVAVTGVSCSNDSEEHIHILTRYIGNTKVTDWLKIANNNNIKDNWTTQFAVEQVWKKNEKKSNFFLVATKGAKIYILVVNGNDQKSPALADTKLQWDCRLFVGTVADNEVSNEKIFNWEEETLLKNNIDQLKKEFEGKQLTTIPFSGLVLINEEKDIFFVLQFINKDTENKKTFAFIKLKESTLTVTFSEIKYANECSFNLFTWNSKIMTLTNCKNSRKMQELKKNEEVWENTVEPISNLLYHLENENYFTTTLINYNDNNKNVLLFIQQQKELACPKESKNFCITLWMTDGNCLYNAGPIFTSNDKETFIDGLLYTNDKLFFLHHEKETEIKTIIFTNLQEQLEKIKSTLNKWKNGYDKINQLCRLSTTSKIPCFTDGLVSFLLISKDKKWKDEYGYNDVKISKCNEFEKGINCDGTGKGEMLPIGKKADNQLYNFINSGFTFVAAVTVGKVAENNNNSILGVGFDDNKKKFGLWCNKKGKWVVKQKENEEHIISIGEDCKNDITYQVMLILEQQKKLAVYIDGHELKTLTAEKIEIATTDVISYFYFGVDNEQTNDITNVTIESFLLYNRPFGNSEIDKLKIKEQKSTTSFESRDSKNSISEKQSDIDSQEITENVVENGGSGSGNYGGGELTPDIPTEEVMTSSTLQRESAVGNNINIIVNIVICSVLLLLL